MPSRSSWSAATSSSFHPTQSGLNNEGRREQEKEREQHVMLVEARPLLFSISSLIQCSPSGRGTLLLVRGLSRYIRPDRRVAEVIASVPVAVPYRGPILHDGEDHW